MMARIRLARISHTNRRIGSPNQRKLLCRNGFTQVRGGWYLGSTDVLYLLSPIFTYTVLKNYIILSRPQDRLSGRHRQRLCDLARLQQLWSTGPVRAAT